MPDSCSNSVHISCQSLFLVMLSMSDRLVYRTASQALYPKLFVLASHMKLELQTRPLFCSTESSPTSHSYQRICKFALFTKGVLLSLVMLAEHAIMGHTTCWIVVHSLAPPLLRVHTHKPVGSRLTMPFIMFFFTL